MLLFSSFAFAVSELAGYVDCSQHRASASVFAFAHLQRRSGGHLKHIPNAILGLGRALQVSKSIDAAGHVSAFLRLDRLLCGSH